VVRDGQIYARSSALENPAAHLIVESKKSGRSVDVWLPPIPGLEQNESSPYIFEGKDLQMAYFTGLEVSHEPGQWSVWAGVLVMGLGLAVVFYFVHVRVWAVPVRNAEWPTDALDWRSREQEQRRIRAAFPQVSGRNRIRTQSFIEGRRPGACRFTRRKIKRQWRMHLWHESQEPNSSQWPRVQPWS
jgi:cytochrome c biogenesis protein ResB